MFEQNYSILCLMYIYNLTPGLMAMGRTSHNIIYKGKISSIIFLLQWIIGIFIIRITNELIMYEIIRQSQPLNPEFSFLIHKILETKIRIYLCEKTLVFHMWVIHTFYNSIIRLFFRQDTNHCGCPHILYTISDKKRVFNTGICTSFLLIFVLHFLP